MKDNHWSVDFFTCESITLDTHTVMVVMDQFTRRIMGFAVFAGHPGGIDTCCLFNAIRAEQSALPTNLSSDNDPLFQYRRWRANLRILDIGEIKSVPYSPEESFWTIRCFGTKEICSIS